MADVITIQELVDASLDAATLEWCINGEAETKVTSRLGRQYWTLATLDALVASGLLKINDLQDAIDIAAAAGAGANGWTDQLITTANGSTQRDINDFGGAKWRNKAGGYALGSTVKLNNGDIVKSTVANNTTDPNVDMTWWVNNNSASQIIDKSGKTQQERNDYLVLSNEKSTLQQVVNTIDATNVIKRGEIVFKPTQNINVDSTIQIDKARINFDGRNALLKWAGTGASNPIFRVTDSSYTKFRDLILIGDSINPPMAAIFFDNITGMTKGTNERISVENVLIARKYLTDTDSGGSANTGVPYGKVLNGIVVGGTFDSNNDEYYINNVAVHDAEQAGFDFRNTQSIWSSINNSLANMCGTGYKLGCNLTMYNVQSNRCVTADIHGIRNIEVSIFGIQSEHANIFIWSQSGASFFVNGGELQKKSTLDGYFFKVDNGGSLVLENLFVENISNDVTQQIYFRAGSAKKGLLKIRNCTIQKGSERNTYDINTASFGASSSKIDIKHDDFVFQTDAPYFDEVKPSVVATAYSSGAISSSAATKIGYGKFVSFAASVSLGTDIQVPICLDTNIVRMRFMNRTGTNITIPATRLRCMDLAGHILSSEKSPATNLTFVGRDVVMVDIPMFGVKNGDFIIPSTDNIPNTLVMTAYASGDNVATVLVETLSTGAHTQNNIILSAAKLDESKVRYKGQYKSDVVTLTSKGHTSFDVAVSGVQIGSHCFVSCSEDLNGICATAHCNTNGFITVVLHNQDSGSKTLPANTWFKVCALF